MLKLLGKYFKEKPGLIIANVVILVIQMVVQTAFLMKDMKNIIDKGVYRTDMDYIISTGIRMLIFTVVIGVVAILLSYISSKIVAYTTCRIREDCYRKAVSLSPQEFGRFGESTLLTRTISDVTQIQILVINFMRTSLLVPIMIVCVLILIFRINVVLFVILAVSFAITLFVLIFLGMRSKPEFEKLQGRLDHISLLMKEKITGVRSIRAFGNEGYEEDKMRRANDDTLEVALAANKKINFLSPIALVIMNWAVVIIYLASNSQLRAGMASISDLILVFQYLSYFIASLSVIPMLVNLLPKVSVSSQRINELLEIENEEEEKKGEEMDVNEGEIEFRDVIFGYAGAVDVIANVSFTAKAGKTTAFIGTTGSGKSTIMNLIMGFYRPTFGDIFVDGQSLRGRSLDVYRTNFSYATQKAYVFSDTARNNITMYDDNMSEDRIKKALKVSRFDEVVELMPDGIDTVMSMGGTNISGGQRQRLSLARTVAKDAKVYIFDDTFSALDAKTESYARNSIMKMLEGKTVLMVAQKIDTIKNADQIIVLDRGRIVGKGSHEKLLNSCKEYQDIYRTQMYTSGGAAYE